MSQVTHNPDVECYADRILYVEDGRFVRQALNETQTRLVYEDYIRYLNRVERDSDE
jgi:putative ABC transport system ATP-binding protein